MELLCPWESAQYLIFSSNVPTLLYYSHFIAILAAIIFALALISRVRESLPIRLFIATIFFFTVWTVLDVLLWASNRADIVLFFWSLQILLEMLLYASAFYFAYVFATQKDLRFLWKLGLVILLTPIIVLLPTAYLLPSIDISFCNALETPFVIFFSYGFEILTSLFIVFVSFWGARTQPARKWEIMLFMVGILVFLIAFSSGNIVGSITEDWSLAQVGLFGMPVFIAFLTYTVVKFKAFNIKLIGAQALIISLVALIGSEFFFIQSNINRILTAITLIVTGAIGINLIRSVKKEVEQRERIEKLAQELQQTNNRQEILFHFIGHEVKGFLTKDAGAFASLLDGDFAPLPEALKPFVTQALAQSRDGARSVTDILTASNQKKGTMTYAKEPFDLKALVVEITEKLKPIAEGKGLTLTFSADEAGAPYTFSGDKGKIGDNVLRNVIDNSINYTPSGSVAVSLKKENGKFVFMVKDTGIGITEEDKKRLFTEGGHGKNSQTINVHSTGYGLFIAKNIIEAHSGTIRAESEGEGKGATFVVELPA